MYADHDLAAWSVLDVEQTGSSAHLWVLDDQNPAELPWLFKRRRDNPAPGGSRYWRGDDWAEKVVGELGKQLGVSCASVELAHIGSDLGIISRKVLREDERLELGNQLLSLHVFGYPREARRGIDQYSISNVLVAITNLGLSPPTLSNGGPESAISAFCGYLLLDALVTNTDRHHKNWAAIVGTSERRLSPSFDHASSLGFQISDAERARRLAETDGVERWAARARTPFADASSPLAAAVTCLSLCGPVVSAYWTGRAAEAEQALDGILSEMPSGRMSTEALGFARELVRINAAAFLSQATSSL